MEKIKIYIIYVIVVAVILAIGAFGGMFYQMFRYAPQIKTTETVKQNLSSNVIAAIVAYGTVTNVDSNRSITLSQKGSEMTIVVDSDAKIYEYEKTTKKTISFENIKIGDSINITASFSASDSQFHGNTVVIFARNSSSAQ